MYNQDGAVSLVINAFSIITNALRWEFKAFPKSIDPCQPVQSAQADMDQNF